MNTFNNARLKELRKNIGYTQLDMANKVGVARTTYAEYEQGKIQPPIDKIQKICRIFAINTSELVKIENNTGIDVSNVHFKQRLSEEDKIIRIQELQKKEKLQQFFSEMQGQIQDMDFEEKAMLLPMLAYLSNKYSLNERDMDIKRRIKGKELANND